MMTTELEINGSQTAYVAIEIVPKHAATYC